MSGNKADIIRQLVTTWKAACDVSPETCCTSAATTIDMPAFNEICSWTKVLPPLTHFTFMQLYHHLVSSKEKTFNKKSMEAFKLFKTYQYFADGLVTNVCTQKLHREDRSWVTVKEYCFASPKAKTTYTVHVQLKTGGEIVCGACTCVAGKGQAYIPHSCSVVFSWRLCNGLVWYSTSPQFRNKKLNVITSPGLISINTLNVNGVCNNTGSVWLDVSLEVVSPPVDCSFPAQPTRSSAAASASSPSAHNFALLPSFLPSYYWLRVLELFFSHLRRWLGWNWYHSSPWMVCLTKCTPQRRSDGSAAAHGHRPLASLEIQRKSADANVYIPFLPTVAVPGSNCAILLL